MAKTYENGRKDGRNEMAGRLLDVLAELTGVKNDSELAAWVGVNQASVSQRRAGHAAPQRKAVQTMMSRLLCGYVEPLAEIESVRPKLSKSEKGWQIDGDPAKRSELRDRLEAQWGAYLFYDSMGRVTYVGHTSTCLYSEIEQRLKQTLRHGAYTREPGETKLRDTDFEQGEVTRFISAYATVIPQAAHNLEAVLIRAFYNNHQNRKQAKIKLGDFEV